MPLNVFPTVFDNTLTFHLESNEKSYTVNLYDLSGKLIYHANTVSNRLDFTNLNLKTGEYILTVNDGISSYSKKIIKRN